MPHPPEESTAFENELTVLAREAAEAQERPRIKETTSLAQSLRPLVVGIEAISRGQAEQSRLLAKLEKNGADSAGINVTLEGMKESWDQKHAMMERLFSGLHGELKTYKDDFLFDLLHKPIIKDLITLFDDLMLIRGQMSDVFAGENASAPSEDLWVRLRQVEVNLQHGVHALEEVLARLQVEKQEPSSGSLNKKYQRAIAIETTEDSSQDNSVAKSVRPGFVWRDRVMRPEEVVLRKYQPNVATHSDASPHQLPTPE